MRAVSCIYGLTVAVQPANDVKLAAMTDRLLAMRRRLLAVLWPCGTGSAAAASPAAPLPSGLIGQHGAGFCAAGRSRQQRAPVGVSRPAGHHLVLEQPLQRLRQAAGGCWIGSTAPTAPRDWSCLGVSVDDDPQRAPSSTRTRTRPSFPLLLDAPRMSAARIEIDRLPTTVLIDRSGRRALPAQRRPRRRSLLCCADPRAAGRRRRGTMNFYSTNDSPMNTPHLYSPAALRSDCSLLLALLLLAAGAARHAGESPRQPHCAARRRRGRHAARRGCAPAAAAAAGAAATGRPRLTRGGTRALDRADPGPEEGCRRSEQGPVRARGGTAVPGQHPGGGVRVDGCRGFLRARLDHAQDRQPRCHQLSVHAARSGRAAQGRRAAAVRRQSQGRRSTSWWRSSTARARTIATTGAAPICSFEKGVGAKYLELKITDHARAQQPEFEIKDWE